MNKILKWAIGMVLVVIAAAILIRAFAQVARAQREEDEEKSEKTLKKLPSVSVQHGETVLTLDTQSQARLGLTVVTLQASSSREQVTAPALVLSVQDLIDLHNAYVAAQTKLEKVEISVNVSRKEYERVKTLYQDDQNASQKSLESAEGIFHSDEADVRAAEQELAMQAAAIRQAWGPAVEQWIVNRSREVERVLAQQEIPVAITLPSEEVSQASPNVSLELPGGKLVQASKVSPIPRIDPRVQSISLLYLTPAQLGLAPNMNFIAHLPVGRKLRGVVVPTAAVVWWQGKAWVYEQTAVDRFTRREVATDMPVKNGFFAVGGLSVGDKVVITGAQMLLSEEYRSQAQGGGESDAD